MSDTDVSEDRCLRFHVDADKDGTRLDRFLADSLDDISRNRLKSLIEDGHVASDAGEAITEPRRKVRPGDVYMLTLPAPRRGGPEPQDMPLDIVYEDDEIIVVDKPAGLVVHPASGNPDRTLVNGLLAHCGPAFRAVGGSTRPGIVHRLDKGTSGIMVAAKTARAYLSLTEAFSRHDIERAYEAVVWGVPAPASGIIEGNIGRSPRNRKKMAVLNRSGKPAITRYSVLKRAGQAAALVRCELETGRTHQIRVHLTHIGHPIVGDPLYGRNRSKNNVPESARRLVSGLDRPLLHAVHLGIIHPATGELLQFCSEKPQIFNGLISSFEQQ